ncbi:MAG: hypothetical protein HY506_02020 [Candidatus Yanofskybacteria bacterium]|nr:hypothetical protein [Candidatus Yanofskybacteria bacterium]
MARELSLKERRRLSSSSNRERFLGIEIACLPADQYLVYASYRVPGKLSSAYGSDSFVAKDKKDLADAIRKATKNLLEIAKPA